MTESSGGEKREAAPRRAVLPALCSYAVCGLPLAAYLFFMLNGNFDYLYYWQVAALGAAGLLLAFAVHTVLGRLLKSRAASAVAICLLWVFFLVFNTVYTWVHAVFGGLSVYWFALGYGLLALVAAAGAAWGLKRIESKGKNTQGLIKGLAFFLSVVWLINFVPATAKAVTVEVNRSGLPLRTEFVVDEGAPSPNIYWFHMDGMLGFDAVERYYGDNQAAFAAALEERGFAINRGAWFEANRKTMYAVPSLMNPGFYDDYVVGLFEGYPGDVYNTLESYEAMISRVSAPNVMSDMAVALQHNELQAAFNAKAGYQTYSIGETMDIFYPVTDKTYIVNDAEEPVRMAREGRMDLGRIENINRFSNLVGLLSDTSMVALAKGPLNHLFESWNSEVLINGPLEHAMDDGAVEAVLLGGGQPREEMLVRCLNDVVQTPGNKFVVIQNLMPHVPFRLNEKGERVREEYSLEPEDYYPQHRYTADVLVGMLDMILENDPDAIVVLQSDHGLHSAYELVREAAAGDVEKLVTLMNGVMSAVRIPEKWGGLQEAPDPLNISRLLVNRYVGENYALLPAGQPNQKNP